MEGWIWLINHNGSAGLHTPIHPPPPPPPPPPHRCPATTQQLPTFHRTAYLSWNTPKSLPFLTDLLHPTNFLPHIRCLILQINVSPPRLPLALT